MFKILFLQFKDNKENVSLRLPGMYLIDQIRPPLQMNLTLYFLDWTNYAEQQKEITSQQHLSSEGQSVNDFKEYNKQFLDIQICNKGF